MSEAPHERCTIHPRHGLWRTWACPASVTLFPLTASPSAEDEGGVFLAKGGDPYHLLPPAHSSSVSCDLTAPCPTVRVAVSDPHYTLCRPPAGSAAGTGLVGSENTQPTISDLALTPCPQVLPGQLWAAPDPPPDHTSHPPSEGLPACCTDAGPRLGLLCWQGLTAVRPSGLKWWRGWNPRGLPPVSGLECRSPPPVAS